MEIKYFWTNETKLNSTVYQDLNKDEHSEKIRLTKDMRGYINLIKDAKGIILRNRHNRTKLITGPKELTDSELIYLALQQLAEQTY